MDYLAVKTLHVGCAIASIAGFAARGVLMLRDSPLLERRWLKVAPHVVDTVLLASALWLTVLIGQYPFVQSWLTAKLLALVAYIVLGTVALKRGRSKAVRATAFALALAAVGYLVTVAFTRDPRGILILLSHT
ncbi:MAG TPA: SirB2 family protein [Steroidobacteraceae bacterium]